MSGVKFKLIREAEPRVILLGKKIGTNKFDAMGRLICLLIYCEEMECNIFDPEILDCIVGVEGFAKSICSELVLFGEKRGDKVRVITGEIL